MKLGVYKSYELNIYGDYLVFDEENRLLKVLSPEDFGNNYTVE